MRNSLIREEELGLPRLDYGLGLLLFEFSLKSFAVPSPFGMNRNLNKEGKRKGKLKVKKGT